MTSKLLDNIMTSNRPYTDGQNWSYDPFQGDKRQYVNLFHVAVVAPFLWFAAEGQVNSNTVKLVAGAVALGHSYLFMSRQGWI